MKLNIEKIKYLTEVINVILLSPLGIFRLLNQSFIGLIQMPLSYVAFTFLKSQTLKIFLIGLLITLVMSIIHIKDILKVYNKKVKEKYWDFPIKVIYFIVGLCFALFLTVIIRYSFSFTYIDNHLIMPFADGKDTTSNTR